MSQTGFSEFERNFASIANIMTLHVHNIAIEKGFWDTDEQGHLGAKIALMHSELSELLDVVRKDTSLKSDKLPNVLAVAEELADVVIRVMDFAGRLTIPLGDAIVEKVRFNAGREFRHGKRF